MRTVLVDWLMDVHTRFEMVTETLFLAVNLLDRFLEKIEISRDILQLVGITCLMIASKFEDIYPPDAEECAFITANTYTKTEVLKMEFKILNTLEFRIMKTTSYKLLCGLKVWEQLEMEEI